MEYLHKLITERIHYFNPAMNIVVKSTITGGVDAERVEGVLQELQTIHPILSSTIRGDNEGALYFVLDTSKKIGVRYLEKEQENQWLEEVKKEENIPFYFSKEPLCRIIILIGKDEFDLVIIGHHLLGDGMSFAYLFRDFMKLYSGEKLELSIRHTRLIRKNSDFLPEFRKIGLLSKGLSIFLNTKAKKIKRKFTEEEGRQLFECYHKENPSEFIIGSLTEEQYQCLKENSKYYGVTINTILITAFLAALRDASLGVPVEDQKITVAINVRSKLSYDAKKLIGNYASGIDISTKYNGKLDFWDNVFAVDQLLKKKLSDPKKYMFIVHLMCLIDGSLFDSMHFAGRGLYDDPDSKKLTKLLGYKSNEKGFDISNLGYFDISTDLKGYKLKDFVYLPPTTTVYDQTLGVVSVGGKLSISLCYKKKSATKECAQQILSRTLEYLSMS